MQKASQKQEYRWEDFRKDDPPPIDYETVKDLDSRFFYYDAYSMISESLLHSTSRSIEEEKFMQWAIAEEDLEPGLALDPTSYAAKAMRRKRKEPPTEVEILSSVRKRPATPPKEGATAESPASTVTTSQARGIQETVIAADGTPTTSAVATTHVQKKHTRANNQPQSQDTTPVGTAQQQSAEQISAP